MQDVVKVAAGILDAHDIGNTAQLLHRRRGQRIPRAGGDIVKQDGRIDAFCHGAVVRIELLLGGRREARRNDGQYVGPHIGRFSGQAYGIARADAARPRKHRHTAGRLRKAYGEHLFLLAFGQDISFAVGAAGEEAVYAAFQHPVDVVSKRRFIDALVRMHRREDGYDDAAKGLCQLMRLLPAVRDRACAHRRR